jgi:hypothetical protein
MKEKGRMKTRGTCAGIGNTQYSQMLTDVAVL